MAEAIISNWSEQHRASWSKADVHLQHRLKQSGLFEKDYLAKVIEKCPDQYYNLTTMGYDLHNPVWREGVLRSTPGRDVIDAIERGRMWLNLRQLEQYDDNFAKLLKDIFSEFQSYVPDFETYKRKIGVLISSPKVQVFYHADVPGQALWQIEGHKKVYVYPNTEEYLNRYYMEGIILGETEEELPYDASYDEGATVYDLGPGEMVHWPLNCPHRVVNEDCLNISVTTEHWTDDIRNSYAVHFANGVLRRSFGVASPKHSLSPAHVYPKAALAMVWKKLKLHEAKKVQRIADFTLDPSVETGMVDIPAFVR